LASLDPAKLLPHLYVEVLQPALGCLLHLALPQDKLLEILQPAVDLANLLLEKRLVQAQLGLGLHVVQVGQVVLLFA
jgi:hypothetical protein